MDIKELYNIYQGHRRREAPHNARERDDFCRRTA